MAEGKKIPLTVQQKYGDQATLRNLRRKLSRSNNNGNGNISYIMPGNAINFSEIIVSIPFEKIGRAVGFSLTIYGYYRMTIMGYRYSQKLIAKFTENRKKNNLPELKIKIYEILVKAYLINFRRNVYLLGYTKSTVLNK